MARSKGIGGLTVQKMSMMIALAAMLGACQDNDPQAADKGSVDASASDEMLTAAIGDAADLSTSARLIGTAELGSALDGEGSYTVFLPVDDAWESLETAELEAIESTENRPQLISVLRQHIAPGYVLASDLEKRLVGPEWTGDADYNGCNADYIAPRRFGHHAWTRQGSASHSRCAHCRRKRCGLSHRSPHSPVGLSAASLCNFVELGDRAFPFPVTAIPYSSPEKLFPTPAPIV